jgi:hypothetical protein
MQMGIGLGINRGAGGARLSAVVRALTANGEVGAWYNARSLQRLYQTSAGATAVTTAGQTVGLVLDDMRAAARGAELRANAVIGITGTATAATYNTATGEGTVARVDASNQSFVRLTGLVADARYEMTITVTGANPVGIKRGSGPTNPNIVSVSAGQTLTQLLDTDSTAAFCFNCGTGGAGNTAFTLTSIKLVAGYHAGQATAANCPLYRGGSDPYFELDGTDAWSVTFPNMGTDATIIYRNADGVTILDNQTISGATTTPNTARIYDLIYLDRALTVSERSRLISALLDPFTVYYADSVNGSDADNGISFGTAEQTISSVAALATAYGSNVSVGLVSGSEWAERLDLSSLTGAQVKGVKSGALPILDATAVQTTWVQHDAANFPNVWSKSIAHDADLDISRLGILEDGVYLPRVASITLCNTTPGSRVCLVDGSLTTNDPATVYIHTTDSANPNSNGKEYRAVIRMTGVSAGEDAVIEGVETRANMENNGSVVVGRSARVSRVVLRDGTKHHLFASSGTVQDCVAVAADLPISGDGGQSFFVGYDADADDLQILFDRCHSVRGSALSQPGNPIGTSAIYSHSQSPALFRSVEYRQCAAVDLLDSGFSAADAQDFIVYGCYSRGADKAFNVGGASYTRAAQFLYNAAFRTQTGIFELEPNGAATVVCRHNVLYPWNWALTRRMVETNANATVTMEYNTFVAPSRYVFGFYGGPVTHRFNIYVLAESGSAITAMTLPSGAVSDYNFYLNTGSRQLDYSYGGVTYNSLAALQAATGQELNSYEARSVSLADVFSGTPADGDFRINTSGTIGGLIAASQAGAQYHWDWTTRSVATGPNEAWPDIPETVAEARTYALDPTAWDYYP